MNETQQEAPTGTRTVGFISSRGEGASGLQGRDPSLETRLFDRLEQMDFSLVQARKATQDLAQYVTDRLPAGPRHVALAERLDQFEARLSAWENKLVPDTAQRDVSNSATRLEEIRVDVLGAIDALAARVASCETNLAETLSSTPRGYHSDPAGIEEIQKLIGQLSPSISARAEAMRDEAFAKVDRASTEITEAISDLADRISVSESSAAAQIEALQETLKETAQTLSDKDADAAAPNDLHDLVRTAVLDALNEGATGAEELAALKEQIATLRTRPDPVVDLGPQRRSFAQFSSTLSQALTRLEKVASTLATQVQSLEQNQDQYPAETFSDLASRIDNLAKTVTEGMVDKSAFDAVIRPVLDTHLEKQLPILKSIEGLGDRIDALKTRPDPVLDLGPQRRSFAQFAAVLTRTVERFDDLADLLSERISSIEPGENAEDELTKKLEAVVAQICKHMSSPSASVPEPYPLAPVVLAQKKSFTRFQTANKATIDRLQTLVDAFAVRFQTLEDRLALLGSDGERTEVTCADSRQDAQLVHPLAKLAEANLVLASSHASADEIISVHQSFLNDLRTALAEHLALFLRDQVDGIPT